MTNGHIELGADTWNVIEVANTIRECMENKGDMTESGYLSCLSNKIPKNIVTNDNALSTREKAKMQSSVSRKIFDSFKKQFPDISRKWNDSFNGDIIPADGESLSDKLEQ